MSDDNGNRIIRPDFSKEIAEYGETVDLAGTRKKNIAAAVGSALQMMQAVWLREQRDKLLARPPCGFMVNCLSMEAAKIIRLVIEDAARKFELLQIGKWEKHPWRPAWRVQFLKRHYMTLAIVAGVNAKVPSFGPWQLGKPA